MIKLILSLVLLLGFTQMNAQDRYLRIGEFPEEIVSFVRTHFPDNTISSIKEEKELLKKEYEVKLDDRTELEFDQKFAVRKIESDSGLPESVVPAKIVAYVTKNYPGRVIEEWKKKRTYQEVELDNSLELVFDFTDRFIRIDD